MLHGFFGTCSNFRDEFRKNLVRNARNDILLLDERRNVHETCCQENRPADVAARANDNIRLKLMDNARGFGHANHSTARTQDIVRRQMALKALNIHRRKGKTFLGDDIGFKTAFWTASCRRRGISRQGPSAGWSG